MSNAQPNPSPQPATPPVKRPLYAHRNRAVTVPEGYLAVGYITGVHGLRGEVKVELYTDFPERFAPAIKLYLGEALQEVTVARARLHKHTLLLLLTGITRREEAEQLRGQWLFVPEEAAVALAEDTYWVHEIIGLEVQTDEGRPLGTISDVLFTGANEVYVVEPTDDFAHLREILLPATDEVIRSIDLDANQMIVHLLPGLIDE
jgi:16S rRNA processing protein RimM